ncbi:nucleotidyl transferase AbiEii/AbiGii toxin family protein [Brevundimonas sp.]|uniref:nucleotidyl transferase AbiEii/AbiGii toxin family protein n=1 Tax=Brevundimonas sp. TaxID=1871086 RepID=UPI0025C5BE27|nr:nucleotidyl transferase AbiEii/AbiGii toxin family protein [Brevundimonas sp.]
MADVFLELDAADRREALQVAAAATGRPVHLPEKDVWVVWLLDVLFRAPFGEHLVFKGGTSLSKAYGLIDRFSEDLDLTYDIRTLAPDLADPHGDGLPAAMAEARRWSRVVRERLPSWVSDTVSPFVEAALASEGLEADLVEDGDKLTVAYGPLTQGTGYAPPSVLLEFGARATGEHAEARDVVCHAASVLPDLVFPTARPRVMKAERTFWEKATAATANRAG